MSDQETPRPEGVEDSSRTKPVAESGTGNNVTRARIESSAVARQDNGDVELSGNSESSGVVAKTTSVLSTIAAIASATTAFFAYTFTETQAERDERLVSIRQIEQFESRMGRLGHPLSCVEFIKSLTVDDPIRDLLDQPEKKIEILIDGAQYTHLTVCLSGLSVPQMSIPGRDSALLEKMAVEINPVLAQIFYNFVIDFINNHDSLVAFREGSVGDPDILDPYLDTEVYDSESLSDLMDTLCTKGGFKLANAYPKLVEEINKRHSTPICKL